MFLDYVRELEPSLAETVDYQIRLANLSIPINEWIGQCVKIQFTGEKRCIACGRAANKLFQNGYCFPCVRSLAECDLCIVKPHECHHHLGTCRDNSFAEKNCMIPHYVYLAWSSGFKVGLTRKGRQIKRWMDQGATQAILVAEVPTRRQAGELEMEIAKHMKDKTDWRKMLREEQSPDRSIQDLRQEVISRLGEDFLEYIIPDEVLATTICYPREVSFQVNLKSANLDKDNEFSGTLRGIKGQYLLFDEGVFNVKKHAGYQVQIERL